MEIAKIVEEEWTNYKHYTDKVPVKDFKKENITSKNTKTVTTIDKGLLYDSKHVTTTSEQASDQRIIPVTNLKDTKKTVKIKPDFKRCYEEALRRFDEENNQRMKEAGLNDL